MFDENYIITVVGVSVFIDSLCYYRRHIMPEDSFFDKIPENIVEQELTLKSGKVYKTYEGTYVFTVSPGCVAKLKMEIVDQETYNNFLKSKSRKKNNE